MSRLFRKVLFGALILLEIWIIAQALPLHKARAAQTDQPVIIGQVHDHQEQPLTGAQAELFTPGNPQPLAQAVTQANGSFNLYLPGPIPDQLSIRISRDHYTAQTLPLSAAQVQHLQEKGDLIIPPVSLALYIGPAFWIATFIFILMLILIGTGLLDNTLAALLCAVLLFAFSYLGRPINSHLFIFDFRRAVTYVDWNVIFLIMGMMMVIAVIERTGVFQWLAFFAYRMSGGRTWLLLIILMLITGILSAFLDNVTTMLLMAPITIQISLALEINPLALLIPEVLASNVIGISTLIGTPTNILIGSFGHIGFNQFLINQTPGVILAIVGLILYCLFIYRNDLRNARQVSPVLLDKLQQQAKIKEPGALRKAGIVGAGMIALFIFGESLNMLPAVTALTGATALLIWTKPNVDEMISAVDWTTLVFFISLFIVVGGVQEVGLISLAAETIGRTVGSNLFLAMLVITWVSAILSTAIANIPFTAAMLPIISFLSGTIPGADNKVLYYCLSVGAAMGGNGSLIGASANMVTAGISEQAGFPLTYVYFLRKGFPALLITVALAFIWLLIRFH